MHETCGSRLFSRRFLSMEATIPACESAALPDGAEECKEKTWRLASRGGFARRGVRRGIRLHRQNESKHSQRKQPHNSTMAFPPGSDNKAASPERPPRMRPHFLFVARGRRRSASLTPSLERRPSTHRPADEPSLTNAADPPRNPRFKRQGAHTRFLRIRLHVPPLWAGLRDRRQGLRQGGKGHGAE